MIESKSSGRGWSALTRRMLQSPLSDDAEDDTDADTEDSAATEDAEAPEDAETAASEEEDGTEAAEEAAEAEAEEAPEESEEPETGDFDEDDENTEELFTAAELPAEFPEEADAADMLPPNLIRNTAATERIIAAAIARISVVFSLRRLASLRLRSYCSPLSGP